MHRRHACAETSIIIFAGVRVRDLRQGADWASYEGLGVASLVDCLALALATNTLEKHVFMHIPYQAYEHIFGP
jgi:hypothetical protein